MRKRDIVDGLVGPRTREMMDQMLCMNGMTNAEKVDFLMSRNRELRAENAKLHAELTDLRLNSCPSCGIKVENEELRELVRDMWPHVRHRSRMCGECELPCNTSDECLLYEPMRQRMAELGIEVE